MTPIIPDGYMIAPDPVPVIGGHFDGHRMATGVPPKPELMLPYRDGEGRWFEAYYVLAGGAYRHKLTRQP